MQDNQNSKRVVGKIRGSTAVPYALIVGLISIVALGAITAGGTAIDNLFTQTGNTLNNVTNPLLLANASPSTCGLSIGQSTTYNLTGGQQSYSVPCTGTYRLTAVAASGGGASASELLGHGARLRGDVTLTAGDTLYIYVGGQGQMNVEGPTNNFDLFGGGFNGGGDASAEHNASADFKAGGGGGATDFRLGGASLNDRILVAGGGGGGGSQLDGRGGNGGGGSCGADYCGGEKGFGWDGLDGTDGGLTGGAGASEQHGGGPGGGGRNSGGMAGNGIGYALAVEGENGSFGQGGNAGGGYVCGAGCGASGGGGGWYGGGGGEHGCCGGATGAGGSSYWGGASFSNIVHTPGDNQGDGSASIAYLGP